MKGQPQSGETFLLDLNFPVNFQLPAWRRTWNSEATGWSADWNPAESKAYNLVWLSDPCLGLKEQVWGGQVGSGSLLAQVTYFLHPQVTLGQVRVGRNLLRLHTHFDLPSNVSHSVFRPWTHAVLSPEPVGTFLYIHLLLPVRAAPLPCWWTHHPGPPSLLLQHPLPPLTRLLGPSTVSFLRYLALVAPRQSMQTSNMNTYLNINMTVIGHLGRSTTGWLLAHNFKSTPLR